MSETWFRVSFYLAMLALGFGGPLVIDWALGGPGAARLAAIPAGASPASIGVQSML